MTSSLAALAGRLGVEPARLAALKDLPEPDLAALDDTVAMAMTHEDDAVENGLEGALRFIPKPLRGRAAKLLFPERRHD